MGLGEWKGSGCHLLEISCIAELLSLALFFLWAKLSFSDFGSILASFRALGLDQTLPASDAAPAGTI